MDERTAIMKVISARYGTLAQPDFHWLRAEIARNPYQDLVDALRQTFGVRDVTDPNTDVSCAFEVSEIGSSLPTMTLRASLVGPYAVVSRHAPANPAETLMDGWHDVKNAQEGRIVEVLGSRGLALLDRATLSLPVPMQLFETSPGRVRVYQALFSDVDFLPGEFTG